MPEHPLFPWLTEPRRAWFYRLARALLAVLVLAHVFGPEELEVAVEVVAAFLGLSSSALAAAHTPRR